MTTITDSETHGVTTFGKDGSTIKIAKVTNSRAQITLSNRNAPWADRTMSIGKTDAAVLVHFLADFASS